MGIVPGLFTLSNPILTNPRQITILYIEKLWLGSVCRAVPSGSVAWAGVACANRRLHWMPADFSSDAEGSGHPMLLLCCRVVAAIVGCLAQLKKQWKHEKHKNVKREARRYTDIGTTPYRNCWWVHTWTFDFLTFNFSSLPLRLFHLFTFWLFELALAFLNFLTF